MKIKTIILILLAILIAPPAGASKKLSSTSQKKIHKVKKPAKPAKRMKYVSPPQDELQIGTIPMVLPISVEAVNALANNNLDEAIRTLRTESPSSKSLYLIKEAQIIVNYKKNKKSPLLDKETFYQNIGIAYHNLFMFLKRNNVINKDFYKNGLKFYGRSPKPEQDILSASLMASYGELEKAEKLFSKIDPKSFDGDAKRLEYLATYYAAIGDAESSINKLKEAYALDNIQIPIWVEISDDFAGIENNPEFKKMTLDWKEDEIKAEAKRKAELEKAAKDQKKKKKKSPGSKKKGTRALNKTN